MKPIQLLIVALLTVSLFTQCTPKVEQPQKNVDIAMEIAEEICNAYPDAAWSYEYYIHKTSILKVGMEVEHEKNETEKFLALITDINAKVDGIDYFRSFSDREHDEKGIQGRFILNVRPDQGEKTSTIFYKYKRMNCSCGQKDSISFIFTTNSGVGTHMTQDVDPGVRYEDGDNISVFTPSTPSQQEELKSFEDFFQAQYNDSRAIRRQETHEYPSDTHGIWSMMLSGPNTSSGDTIKTNVVFSQRPVKDDAEFSELLRMVEQYKGTDKCLIAKNYRDSYTFNGKALAFMLLDEKENLIVYYAVLEDGVFSILKATKAPDEGINIYYNWWK